MYIIKPQLSKVMEVKSDIAITEITRIVRILFGKIHQFIQFHSFLRLNEVLLKINENIWIELASNLRQDNPYPYLRIHKSGNNFFS